MSGAVTSLFCLLLARSSIAATLYSEKDSSVVRREKGDTVQLSAHGDVLAPKKMGSSPTPAAAGSGSGSGHGSGGEIVVSTHESLGTCTAGEDFCKCDFSLGTEGGKQCIDDSGHHLILQENLCIDASKRAHVTTSGNTFTVTYTDWAKHPKGCFYVKDCPDGVNGHDCYRFNAEEEQTLQNTTVGTPVCSRPKYKFGTKDSIGGANGGIDTRLTANGGATCPTGYSAIMHEEACSAAAQCLGKLCVDAELTVGEHNESKRMDRPAGCFVAPDQDCMFFNPETKINGGIPSAPRGTPVCNVSTVVTFDDGTLVMSTQEPKHETHAAYSSGGNGTVSVATASRSSSLGGGHR